METNKVVAWVIVVIVIILIILALCYWFWSGNKAANHGVDVSSVKCLAVIKRALGKTCCLTREYIIESFTNFPGKHATRDALEEQYRVAFSQYFGGCKEKTDKVVADFMAKYPLYDQVIADPETLECAKQDAHRLNVTIAANLSHNGCPHNGKLVGILDSIDAANFDQITTIQASQFAQSHKAFNASCAATDNFFKWLSFSYLYQHDKVVKK
jgi:hypothetical protein